MSLKGAVGKNKIRNGNKFLGRYIRVGSMIKSNKNRGKVGRLLFLLR
ncbi:MAG: hypothetical protein ACTSQO_12185 [Candidatus Helarchaeota archaeon]